MADLAQQTRAQIEAGMASDLAELNAGLANQLAKHLKMNPANPQIPDGFWDELETRNRDLLALWLLLTWSESSRRHGWPDRDNQEAGRRWAEQRAKDVAKKFTETTKERIETAAKNWKEQQEKAQAATTAKPATTPTTPKAPQAPPPAVTPEDVDDKVDEILGPDRAATVAVTETSNAVTDASDAAMDAQGLKTDLDTWFTERDQKVCQICGPLHGQPREVWQQAFDAGPPAHPNCRCWIKYDNESGNPDGSQPKSTGDHGVSTQGFTGAFRP